MTSSEAQRNQKQILRALLVAGILLLFVFGAAITVLARNFFVQNDVESELRLERRLNETLEAVKDGETGQRGYLLTSDTSYLAPFRNAEVRAMASLQRARGELDNFAGYGLAIDSLHRLIEEKFAELELTIATFDDGDPQAAVAIVNNDSGKRLMDDIRAIVSRLKTDTHADALELTDRSDRLQELAAILSAITLLALLYLLLTIYRRLRPLLINLVTTLRERDDIITAKAASERQRLDLIRTLEAKNEELDHFAYIASHDLQEPLRTVSNFVQILEEDHGAKIGPDGDTYFNFINEATDHMRMLIDKLLRYSQLGRTEEPQQVDLNELAAATLQNIHATIVASEAKIVVEKLPDKVIGHPVELKQLFQNLISNALKFVPPGRKPEVKIYSSSTAGGHEIFIADNGIGVSPSDRQKIFQMFSRVHAKGTYGGHGIGLSFCRRIAELHGGKMTLDSTPGKGSVFSFTLSTKNHHEKTVKPSSID